MKYLLNNIFSNAEEGSKKPYFTWNLRSAGIKADVAGDHSDIPLGR